LSRSIDLITIKTPLGLSLLYLQIYEGAKFCTNRFGSNSQEVSRSVSEKDVEKNKG